MLLVCAVTLLVFSLFGPNAVSPTGITASWVSAGLLVALAVAFQLTPPQRIDSRGGYVLIALIGVTLCCGMNWITSDPSAGAQAFLAFPVLWAGVHLRRGAVARRMQTASLRQWQALLAALDGAEDAVASADSSRPRG